MLNCYQRYLLTLCDIRLVPEWQKAIDEANIIQRQSGEDQSTRIAQLYCELTQQNISKRILRITKFLKNFKFQGVE